MMKDKIIKESQNEPPYVLIMKSMEDIDEILLLINKKRTVIANFSMMDKKDFFHVVDFLNGHCYALNGVFTKIDSQIFKIHL